MMDLNWASIMPRDASLSSIECEFLQSEFESLHTSKQISVSKKIQHKMILFTFLIDLVKVKIIFQMLMGQLNNISNADGSGENHVK